jgi:hypothetical protein
VIRPSVPVRAGWRRPFALLLLLPLAVLALAGCRGEEDPREELRSAVATTADESFTFALSARADRAALDQLGDDAVAAAAFLEGAGVTGARDPDGRFQVALMLGGDAPLLEAISEGGEGLLLRTGLGDLLGLGGRDPQEALGPALDELDIEPAGRAALTASFEGRWVALTDVGDLGELIGTTDDGDGGEPADLAAVLEEVTVTGARDAGDVRRIDVLVPADTLLGPLGLGGGDRIVPGSVDLRDGRISEVRLELSGGDLAGEPGTVDAQDPADAGVVELVLRLTPAAGPDPLVERPDPGASLTAAQLLELVARLQEGPLGAR